MTCISLFSFDVNSNFFIESDFESDFDVFFTLKSRFSKVKSFVDMFFKLFLSIVD